MTGPLKVVEICAGAGGQSLGLHRAGFEHALAVELDETAAATLRGNLERLQDTADVRVGDVADPSLWTPEDFGGVDLLAGGVPCPPFSIAGKQLGSQDERDLFAWAVELTGRIKPRALLLENVRGLSMPRFAGYRQAVADRLEELGYWSEWRLLQASDFGVPQLRPRFILVAMSHEDARYFSWPEPEPNQLTVGDALRDLMGARGWPHLDEWVAAAQGIGPTIVGGSKKHGGADLGPTRAKVGWARLGVDGRGVANEPPAADAPHHCQAMPRLTNPMVAAIQGWGPEYKWDFVGRKTSVYRQIGNAFPPPVAFSLGRSLRAALMHESETGRVSRAVHDDLYLALRRANGSLSEQDLLRLVPSLRDPLTLHARIRTLGRDFDVSVEDQQGATYYSLGEFRAFRGQDDHLRNDAFRESVARIS